MYYLPKNNGAHYVVKKCIKMANNRCSCQIRFFMFFVASLVSTSIIIFFKPAKISVLEAVDINIWINQHKIKSRYILSVFTSTKREGDIKFLLCHSNAIFLSCLDASIRPPDWPNGLLSRRRTSLLTSRPLKCTVGLKTKTKNIMHSAVGR